MSAVVIESAVRGHHVYRSIWAPVIDEVFVCKRERHNIHDPFAVAVCKGSAVVGHVPRRIALALAAAIVISSLSSVSPRSNGRPRFATGNKDTAETSSPAFRFLSISLFTL